MCLMLQQPDADDYVIATGQSNSLKLFIELAFREVELDWQDHLQIDATLIRPVDITVGRANPSRARHKLGWQAKTDMKGVVTKMISHELSQIENQ